VLANADQKLAQKANSGVRTTVSATAILRTAQCRTRLRPRTSSTSKPAHANAIKSLAKTVSTGTLLVVSAARTQQLAHPVRHGPLTITSALANQLLVRMDISSRDLLAIPQAVAASASRKSAQPVSISPHKVANASHSHSLAHQARVGTTSQKVANAHPKTAPVSLLNQLCGTTPPANADVLTQAPAKLLSSGTMTFASVSAPHSLTALKARLGITPLANAAASSACAQLVSTGTLKAAPVFAVHLSAPKANFGTLIDASVSVPSQKLAATKASSGTSQLANVSASMRHLSSLSSISTCPIALRN
jgi:hypothetical protein